VPAVSVPIQSTPTPDAPQAEVHLSEVLSALSHALDLTEGQPLGHSVRSCLIGLRIAEAAGLDVETRAALYYALLLKDAGCSSNSARMASLFGSDDGAVKYEMKFVDWHRRASLAFRTLQHCGGGRDPFTRVRHFLQIARTPQMTREVMQTRCERGADIASRLGFPLDTAGAIRALDEHWCGLGHPVGLRGDDIPVLARIANFAQTVEAFHARYGHRKALAVAHARSGTWFDPRLVDALLKVGQDRRWWADLGASDVTARAAAADPSPRRLQVDGQGLTAIAQAFAEIIDAKTPYTYKHSSNVADFALGIARELGMSPDEQTRLYRAGLLHDIGKLGVSNRVLDKPGRLTDDERAAVERHPRFTWEILSRVTAFDDFAWLAAVHHEKLDGSGYPWGLTAERLDRSARVLAIADIYEALTADRPYRAGMTPAQAMAIIDRDVAGGKLCSDSAAALTRHVALQVAAAAA